MRIYLPRGRAALAVVALAVALVWLLVGVGAYYVLLSPDTIETEQASNEEDSEASEEEDSEASEEEDSEASEEEDTTASEEEDSEASEEEDTTASDEETVTRIEVVYVAEEPNSASSPASDTAPAPATKRSSQQGEMMEPEYMDPKQNEWQAKGYQTTDPNAPFYHPPSGPCLGQCTNAEGKNNADLQSEALQSIPQRQATPSGASESGKVVPKVR